MYVGKDMVDEGRGFAVDFQTEELGQGNIQVGFERNHGLANAEFMSDGAISAMTRQFWRCADLMDSGSLIPQN